LDIYYNCCKQYPVEWHDAGLHTLNDYEGFKGFERRENEPLSRHEVQLGGGPLSDKRNASAKGDRPKQKVNKTGGMFRSHVLNATKC